MHNVNNLLKHDDIYCWVKTTWSPPFLGHVVLVEGERKADGLQHLRYELHVPGQLKQGNIVGHLVTERKPLINWRDP